MGKVRLPLELEFDSLNTMVRFLASPGPGVTVVTGDEAPSPQAVAAMKVPQRDAILADWNEDIRQPSPPERRAHPTSKNLRGHDQDGKPLWRSRAFTDREDSRIMQAWGNLPQGVPVMQIGRDLEYVLERSPGAISQRVRTLLKDREDGK